MFYQHSNGSATLPRGFRFHYDEPKTPEPAAHGEQRPIQPSPPRPARLKVRRRNPSSAFRAPTEQFLASVAAADIPIPTIEEPRGPAQLLEDLDMPDRQPLSINTAGFLAPRTNSFRPGSPPKTPMPDSAMEEGYSGRPDWSAGASSSPPPCDYTRPMSSLSNNSDFSDDSFYSGSRISRRSEDGSCTSPESDVADPFQFGSYNGKGKVLFLDQPIPIVLTSKLLSKIRKDAKWTKAQSAHLWSVYMTYLSDPTVTPFRIGASAVPPQGIVHRVAREAKRSWKGPKLPVQTIRRSTRLSSTSRANSYDKSGSITPTGETSKVYAQWPHSSNMTRAHLRELCKTKDSNPVQRHHHFQSRSPTPFSKPYLRLRKSETPRLSSFSTADIALSLATSTAESMQPNGPLAQLTKADSPDTPTMTSRFQPLEDFKPLSFGKSRGLIEDDNRGRRLGSPFTARTYGPSSSKMNAYRPSPPRTQSDTTSEPHLGSPVRFDEPRSLNATMKRRAQNSLDEELSPRGAVLRPSVLNDQLFGGPFKESRRRVRSRGFSLGDEALRHRAPGAFPRSPTVPSLPTAVESPIIAPEPLTAVIAPPTLLPSVTFNPRLGSPFSESGSSKTFPRRLFQDGSATIRRSQFATMHQTRRSIESFDFGQPAPQSRLAHLDDKLREIRERQVAARGQNQD